jgi:hypothetical protein
MTAITAQAGHLLVERRGAYFGATDASGEVVFSFVPAAGIVDKLILNGVDRVVATLAVEETWPR